MALLPLTLDAEVLDHLGPEPDMAHQPDAALASRSCQFCGIRSGAWGFPTGMPVAAACPLCHLAQHLERPRIDQEALLVWLPEVSQPALNTLMREVHLVRLAVGDSLVHGDPPRPHKASADSSVSRAAAYHAGTAIAARAATAAERLGTHLPSELAATLQQLSPAARPRLAPLLGGLRVMPLGCFYRDGKDVYPAIVAAWRGMSHPGAAGGPALPAPAAAIPSAASPPSTGA